MSQAITSDLGGNFPTSMCRLMHLVPLHGDTVLPAFLAFAVIQLYLKYRSFKQKSEVGELGELGFISLVSMLLAARILRFLVMGYFPSYLSSQVRQIFSQFDFSKNFARCTLKIFGNLFRSVFHSELGLF